MEGIYIAYVSGAEGYSAILFVLRNGRLTGADIGGMKYVGEYEVSQNQIVGNLFAEVPANAGLISGFKNGDSPTKFNMPFSIEITEIGKGIIYLKSPFGDLTANISKIQELP